MTGANQAALCCIIMPPDFIQAQHPPVMLRARDEYKCKRYLPFLWLFCFDPSACVTLEYKRNIGINILPSEGILQSVAR